MKDTGKDFYIILIGRAFQAIFALVSVRMTTTLLGPSQMGRMNLITGITAWFGLLLISPISNYVYRQAIEWDTEGKLVKYIKRYIVFILVAAIGGLIVLFVIYFSIGIGTPILLSWLVWLVIATIVLGTLNTNIVIILNTLGFRGWYVLFANLTSWLGLGAAIGIALFFGREAEFWITGLLLGQVVITIFSGIILYRVANRIPKVTSHSGKVAGFDINSIFRFSWPLIFATGFYWIQNSGYRFALVHLTDAATLGLFTTGLAIAMSPMVMFENLFTEYYRPIFYKDIAFSDRYQQSQAWNRYASAYFPAIILFAVYMAFGGSFLARILVSEAFRTVSWLALWGAVIQGTLMVYSTFVSFVFASLDTRVMIIPNILGACVVLIVIWILVPHQPLLGAGIALALGMLTTTIILASRIKQSFALVLPWKRILTSSLLAVPMFLGLTEFSKLWPQPTTIQSLLSLSIAGLYMLGVQFLLAREWLFNRSEPTLTQISVETIQ